MLDVEFYNPCWTLLIQLMLDQHPCKQKNSLLNESLYQGLVVVQALEVMAKMH